MIIASSTSSTRFFTLYDPSLCEVNKLTIALAVSLAVISSILILAIILLGVTYYRYAVLESCTDDLDDFDYLESVSRLRRLSEVKSDVYVQASVLDTLDYEPSVTPEPQVPNNTPRDSLFGVDISSISGKCQSI